MLYSTLQKQSFLLFMLIVFAHLPAKADIVFSSKVMGPVANIYEVNTEGKITKLTDDTSWRDLEGSVSKNGDILFLSNRKKDKKIELAKVTDTFNVFLVEKKTGKEIKLTDNNHNKSNLKFSPNGKWVSFLENSQTTQTLIIIDLKDKKPKTLISQENILDYDWSPDSETISFAKMTNEKSSLNIISIKTNKVSQLLEINKEQTSSETANTKPITNNDNKNANLLPGHIVATSQWSPDAKKIAYILSPITSGTRKLYIYDLTTKKSHLVSNPEIQVQSPVSWDSKGETLLYSALVGYNFYWDEKKQRKVYEGGMHIYLTKLTGETQQLTDGDRLHNRPVFSPDNKSIAFLYADSLANEQTSIRIMNTEGKNIKELYPSALGSTFLHWR